MSISLPESLPASVALRQEGLDVVASAERRAWRGRRLKIAIINLMPAKAVTETQLARLLGGTPWQVDLTLLIPDGYEPKNTPVDHIERFYRRWSDVRDRSFDGLIVTGAPIETLPFETVRYWSELTEILDWADRQVSHKYFICWAALAALWHYHRVPKQVLAEKLFGVFEQQVMAPQSRIVQGLGARFPACVSRSAGVHSEDLARASQLRIVAGSPESGVGMIEDTARRAIFMLNHLEYDASTLIAEYERDVAKGEAIDRPYNYWPDEQERASRPHWRAQAERVFCNWLDMIAGDVFTGDTGQRIPVRPLP